MTVALRNLIAERARLIVALAGVAFAVALVLIMVGVFVGTTNQVTTYIDNNPETVWVMQAGVDQMFRSVSRIPASTGDAVRGVGGVGDVSPILGVPTSFVHDGGQTAFYLLGYEPSAPLGGPWKLASGRAPQRPGEAVFDRVLARKNDVRIGDSVKLIDELFDVVGLSDGTAAVGNFYVFISMDDARRVLRAPDIASYLLVRPSAGTDVERLATSIRAGVPSVTALTATRFAENSRAIVVSIIGRPLKVMIAVGALVGVSIVALTILSLASEQRRDFSVLKAVGARNRQLYGVVSTQALVLAVVGYGAGAAVAYLAQFVVRERIGDVTVQVTGDMLAVMFAVTLGMAVVAALSPARRVAAIDPADAFRI